LALVHAEAFERAWTEDEFDTFLEQETCEARLATADQSEPVGLILWRRLADELELLTLGVALNHRRRGVGQCLMREMIRCSNGDSILLEVGAGNTSALGLYAQFGFKTVGRRVRYYRRGEDGREDAMVMRRTQSGDSDQFSHEN